MPVVATKPAAPAQSRGGMGRASWLAQQNGRKATLYVVRLCGNGETFYKVGITFCASARTRALHRAYTLRTLARYSSYSAGRVWDLEQQMHTALAAGRYVPLLPFAGHTECFADAGPILALLPNGSFVLKHVNRDQQ